MTEQEAIEYLENHGYISDDVKDMAIKALETMQVFKKRNMKIKDLKNYMQFEDECVKKGFTFESLLKARELQIAHKVEEFGFCPDCCYDFGTEAVNYCPRCGQKLDRSE